MNNIKGTIKPLRDRVFVSNMEFGAQVTKGGLFVPSANGKSQGITPRWGKVWAIGPDQKDVKVGEWIMIEHGRWTRTVPFENDDGSVTEIRMVDSSAIIMVSEEEPVIDIYRSSN
jgi:co-chaperonin GroES (HSP10)